MLLCNLDTTYISSKCNCSNGADETPPAAKEDDEERDNDGKDQSSSPIVTVPGTIVHSLHLGLAHYNHIVLKLIVHNLINDLRLGNSMQYSRKLIL